MSLVSSVSQTLMGDCEAESNEVTLAALKSAGRSLFEMLRTDVPLVGFDHDWTCANRCPFH